MLEVISRPELLPVVSVSGNESCTALNTLYRYIELESQSDHFSRKEYNYVYKYADFIDGERLVVTLTFQETEESVFNATRITDKYEFADLSGTNFFR